MFIRKAEMRRILQQLAAAEKRALRAEEALASERQAKDWLTLQLSSRVITKHGGYGLDYAPQPTPTPQPADPRHYTHEPTVEDLAKQEYYIRCYAERGWSKDDAIALWEAEMRGEQPVYPYEREQYDDEQAM